MRRHWKLFAALAVLLLLCGLPAAAQNTNVTGTVTDPNSIPYANATIKFQLVTTAGVPIGGQPTVTVSSQAQCSAGSFGTAPCQVPFQGTLGPVLMNTSGGFAVTLQDNALITPAATKWLPTVSLTPGIFPPLGVGAVTFSPAAITITGGSQSISTQLNAAAPQLTTVALGGGGAVTLANTHIFVGNAMNVATDVAMSGDATMANTGALTLASVVAPATCGDATHSPGVTFNAKGLITACTSNAISAGVTCSACTVGVIPRTTGAGTLGDGSLTDDGAGTLSRAASIILQTSGAGDIVLETPANRTLYLNFNNNGQIFLGNSLNKSIWNGGLPILAGYNVQGSIFTTATNCSNAASPAVCGAAASGVVAVPTGATPTLQINTTAVTSTSRLFFSIDESSTIAATTCNTTLSTLVQPVVVSRNPGVSVTIQINATLAVNPACVSFWVIN